MSSYMMARRATSKNYRFLTTDASPSSKPTHARSNSFDLNESDVWGGGGGGGVGGSTQSNSAEYRAPARKARYGGEGVAASMPVKVPDWSKILREEYKGRWRTAEDGGDDGEEKEEEWVAPHEYLSRTRNASLSVQEGVGRTLKGRDLSRLRNAIWEKTGFQD